jgi:hypothetical protein
MILFLHWQRGRGKEGLGNGYCLGLGCLITLAEGKRERGKEGLGNGYCLGLGCFISLAEGKRETGFRKWLLFWVRKHHYN